MTDDSYLASRVERLAGVRVLVAGDAMLDHYVVGSVDRISPEAPVPVLRVEREFDRVGGAANVAANVVALGGAAALVTLAGRDGADGADPHAARLLCKCEDLGIRANLLRLLPATIRKTRMLAGKQQMLRVDWEQPFGRTDAENTAARDAGRPWEPLPLTGAAVETRAEALGAETAACDAILVSDYAKGMIDQGVMDRLRAADTPVVVDPRPQHTDYYRDVTLVTPNRKEATEMLGLDPRYMLSGEELGKRLRDKLNANMLITLGAEGMCLVTVDDVVESIPTRAREVFDVTGAGDTVAATVALGLGAGLSLSESAHLANAAAGVVVAHIGTASVRPDELRAALASD